MGITYLRLPSKAIALHLFSPWSHVAGFENVDSRVDRTLCKAVQEGQSGASLLTQLPTHPTSYCISLHRTCKCSEEKN